MAPTTERLLARLGPLKGLRILDAGCGTGELSRELHARAGPGGAVVGIDLDATKIAQAGGGPGLAFHVAGVEDAAAFGPFDLVYARYLIGHLTDPVAVLCGFRAALRRGGRIAVEDVEYAAHLCEPPSQAFARYVGWYQAAARARGADADIGPKLPGLLRAAGFQAVQAQLDQPAGLQGPVKTMAVLTLSAITQALEVIGVSRETAEATLAELEMIRRDPTVFVSTPRITQAWAVNP